MTGDSYSPRYPLFLDIRHRRVVVVSGGHVAERKVTQLLSYGPNLLVVAPEVTEQLRGYAERDELVWHRAEFTPSELQGAVLVFCATGDKQVGAKVRDACNRCGILLNVADVPGYCDFIVPSVVQRGPLQIAVSTSGAAPSLARQLRCDLEQHYPSIWERYTEFLGEVRDEVKRRYPDDALIRCRLLKEASSAGFLERLESGEVLTGASVVDSLMTRVLLPPESEIMNQAEGKRQ